MKSVIVLSFLCFLYSFAMDTSVSGTLLQLPSKEILWQRLAQKGFIDFLKSTHIAEKLGGKNTSALHMIAMLETEIEEYTERAPSLLRILMERSKGELIDCILAEYPQAINELKKTDIVKIKKQN